MSPTNIQIRFLILTLIASINFWGQNIEGLQTYIKMWETNSLIFQWAIRILNKLLLIFFVTINVVFKIVVKTMWRKYCSLLAITSSHLTVSIWIHAWIKRRYPRIDSSFGIFIRMEVLLSQAMWHRSKQIIIRMGNIWWIRWM